MAFACMGAVAGWDKHADLFMLKFLCVNAQVVSVDPQKTNVHPPQKEKENLCVH